jgi:SAM-dependent methyltransferase
VKRLQFLYKSVLSRLLWYGWRKQLNKFGFDTWPPTSTGRLYLEHSLQSYKHLVRGSVLEFYPSYYKQLISRENNRISRYDVANLEPAEGVTVIADLMNESSPTMDSQYDLIICTQVLEHVPNPFIAVGTLNRWLRPNGHALVTVPVSYPYHADPKDYWRFTKDSAEYLFKDWKVANIRCFGNRLMVVAAYWYWMVEDLPSEALWVEDDTNATIISIIAQK